MTNPRSCRQAYPPCTWSACAASSGGKTPRIHHAAQRLASQDPRDGGASTLRIWEIRKELNASTEEPQRCLPSTFVSIPPKVWFHPVSRPQQTVRERERKRNIHTACERPEAIACVCNCVCTWVPAKCPAVAWRLAPALGVRQTFIAALLCATSSVADPELERPAATIAVRFLTTHRLRCHPRAILEAIVLIF